VSRHNPRADRLNQLKRRRIPRSGPNLPVTDNLGSQEYKIKKEIAVMKLCRHPHVVRLLEVIDDKLYQKVYMGQFVPICCPASSAMSLTLSQLWSSSEAVKSSGVMQTAIQSCG
jgi:hypothetical protein